MTKATDELKTVIKFDTGADGFLKMIYVLAIGAIIVLIVGVYFLFMLNQEIKVLS